MTDLLKLKAITAATRLALLVREPVWFWLRVARRSRRMARYRLRGSDVVIHVRHGTVDIITLDQIVRLGHYELPSQAAEALEHAQHPLQVVDLGANIGLFGAYVRRLDPDAEIVSFEPHPANLEVLSRSIAANGGEPGWLLIPACADVRDGTVPFAIGGELTTARIEPGAPMTISVPAVDVFPFLREVDLLKIDIEGSEWRILADPRFPTVPARAIALEYHAYGCPAPGPGAHARRLLEGAGYETAEGDFEAAAGHGMLWAWRYS
jgi:FkbM family methyltransferase